MTHEQASTSFGTFNGIATSNSDHNSLQDAVELTIITASNSAHNQLETASEVVTWQEKRALTLLPRTDIPSFARGPGRDAPGPEPSMKPCASISTSFFTASGNSCAKSRAMAPPSDAPTRVIGRPPMTCFQNSKRCVRFASGRAFGRRECNR